jgi:hypothetical protein
MGAEDFLSHWKELYIVAILEVDSEQIQSRIHAAKMAICDRVEELNGGGVSELQEVYRNESSNHHAPLKNALRRNEPS